MEEFINVVGSFRVDYVIVVVSWNICKFDEEYLDEIELIICQINFNNSFD